MTKTAICPLPEAVYTSSNNDLLPYLKLVGVGKNGAKSLSREDAHRAMDAVLTGRLHPVTFGAFFMALRFKGETPEELAGFLDALSAAIVPPVDAAPEGTLNCSGAYDGKARTCNVSLGAALVTVAAGTPVVLHGARDIPTKHGMTISHVMEALRIAPATSRESALDDLSSTGIVYLDQRTFLPGLSDQLNLRHQMGKRTILNTLETLSNPLGARAHLGGFFHEPYADLICEALKINGRSFERATLVQGIEGSDELRPGRMLVAGIAGGQTSRETVDSEALGLPVHISDLAAPQDSLQARVAVSTSHLKQLLATPSNETPYRNAVLLSAAVRLYAAGACDDMPSAVATAKAALEAGGAAEVLTRWKTRNPA